MSILLDLAVNDEDVDVDDVDAGPEGPGGEPDPVAGEPDPTASEPDPVAGEPDPTASEPDPAASDEETSETGPAERPARPPASRRRVAFAAVRAIAVLVLAAVAYQAVIPSVHVVRSRLSRLVVTRTGVAAFGKAPTQSGPQDDTQTGLAAVTAAAKKSPNKTGMYGATWSTSQTTGAAVIAFLLPSASQAATAAGQIRTQLLSPTSYASDSLSRTSTDTVKGVPGSAGAVFNPSSKSAGSSPPLAISVFQYGRVAAVAEASTAAGAQADVATLALREYAALRQAEPGFSLTETYRPPEATALWVAGALVLAAIVALGPWARRRWARRRQRRIDEELAHQVVVGSQVIYKYRR